MITIQRWFSKTTDSTAVILMKNSTLGSLDHLFPWALSLSANRMLNEQATNGLFGWHLYCKIMHLKPHNVVPGRVEYDFHS